MSEIIHMNQKLNALVKAVGLNQTIGENVFFEMLITFAYTEGFKDGYAKGYAEAICDPLNAEEEGNNSEVHKPV